MAEGSISRRGLLKLGVGSVAGGGALLTPRVASAADEQSVKATVRQGAFPLLMGDSLTGVAAVGYGAYQGGIARLAAVPDSRRGTMSRVNLVSAGANCGVRADWTSTPISLADSETFEFWAYLESPAGWPNGNATSGAPGYLYLSDPTFTNYFSAYFTLRRGWNFVRLGRDRFVPVGNPSWNNTFPVMRTAIAPCSGGPISAYFSEFRKSGRDRPLVCIMFDDGEESARLNGLPILTDNGIPSTIAVISGNMGKTLGARTFSSLQQLATAPSGTAFVNHTVSHRQNFMNYERTPYNMMLQEIQGCIDACQSLPGFDATCFAAPYGEWGTRYLQALGDCGILYSRSIVFGSGPGFRRYTGSRLDNNLLLCSLVVTPTTSPQELLDYIDLGIQSCQSMIIVFHDIRPSIGTQLDYLISDFATFASGLPQRAADADFVTFPTFCQRLSANGLV